jgi:uncharacterized protein (TIGR00369 family)
MAPARLGSVSEDAGAGGSDARGRRVMPVDVVPFGHIHGRVRLRGMRAIVAQSSAVAGVVARPIKLAPLSTLLLQSFFNALKGFSGAYLLLGWGSDTSAGGGNVTLTLRAGKSMAADTRDESSTRPFSPPWLGTSGPNPFHQLLGLVFEQVDPLAVVTLPLCEKISGVGRGDTPDGQPIEQSIHGGALATLLDAAGGAALAPMLQANTLIQVTTEMNVRYYRQPRSSPLTAEARVVHGGRRLACVECVIKDAEDRVIVRGSATYMLIPPAHSPAASE